MEVEKKNLIKPLGNNCGSFPRNAYLQYACARVIHFIIFVIIVVVGHFGRFYFFFCPYYYFKTFFFPARNASARDDLVSAAVAERTNENNGTRKKYLRKSVGNRARRGDKQR
jgi:hypothetical protein